MYKVVIGIIRRTYEGEYICVKCVVEKHGSNRPVSHRYREEDNIKLDMKGIYLIVWTASSSIKMARFRDHDKEY
jgi:hypothetical protein